MRVARVAIPRSIRRVLSYSVPHELSERVRAGVRVLVPLGTSNRRHTGYVLGTEAPGYVPVGSAATAAGGDTAGESAAGQLGPELKPILDVLDEEPLFGPDHLALFEFVARYYHAPLADVIRTGLPAGLNVKDARMAELTELGRTRAHLDPLLGLLAGGARPLKDLPVSTSTLLGLAEKGLLSLRYELGRPRATARYESIVHPTGLLPGEALKPGAGPAVLLELLGNEGPQEVRSLKGRVPNHGPAVRRLVAIGAARVERTQAFRDPWRGDDVGPDVPPPLTPAQSRAVLAVCEAVDSGRYEGFLLRGVTGSGKTEVYLHVLAHALERGRTGIVLVPEIALTPQLAGRFRARFGERVAVLHSGLLEGERLDQWELIRRRKRPCVVGARSAIFAPVPDLGLIVVDEEHEGSFKQDDAPRYHARDVALKRGFDAGCPVLLGSATPSLESIANADAGRLRRLLLADRIGDRPMPEVELVDLRMFPPVRPGSLLSRPLLDAIAEVVSRREQAIVFLNRRGFANFFMCPPPCGHVPECPHCSVSLTYHRSRRRLCCHYCGHVSPVPAVCPSCRTGELQLVGTGTEQVESVLAELLPRARVARMDRDTTRGHALRRILASFRAREVDVLVGTQMVAKGHDFPAVTLVGVLLAEQTLKLQDFRASERTFQLLTQVAGRAGRHDLPGRVLIQTCEPDHYSLTCAVGHDTESFVRHESNVRRLRGFPPFSHVALVRLDAPEPHEARDGAGRVARCLRESLGPQVHLIGPNPAPIERIKGRTRYQILLSSRSRSELHRVIALLDDPPAGLLGGARLAVDVDPVNLL